MNKKYINLFWPVMVPINFWAIGVYLFELPSMLKNSLVTEMIGKFGYFLSFALFECVIVWLMMLLAVTVLWRNSELCVRIYRVMMIYFVLVSAATLRYIMPFLLIQLGNLIPEKQVYIGMGIYLFVFVSIPVLAVLFIHSGKFQTLIHNYLEHSIGLGKLYLAIDLIAVFIVISRNFPWV